MKLNTNQMKPFIMLLFLTSLFSCNKENESEINNAFEVTSAGEGIDCGLILIDFREEDRGRIEKITGQTAELRYFGYNLDKKFDQVGLALIVTVRKTKEDESFACTTQGPSYPWVTVLTAIEKE